MGRLIRCELLYPGMQGAGLRGRRQAAAATTTASFDYFSATDDPSCLRCLTGSGIERDSGTAVVLFCVVLFDADREKGHGGVLSVNRVSDGRHSTEQNADWQF